MKLSAAKVFARVQRHCLDKPEVVEEYPWDDVVWKVGGKMFAATAPGADRVTVKATLEEQAILTEHDAIEVASYVGRFGWITITIADTGTLSLAFKLIDDSYEAIRKGKSASRKKPGRKQPGRKKARERSP